MERRIRAVILDWDGTLVDSNFIYVNAFKKVLNIKDELKLKGLIKKFSIPPKQIIKEYMKDERKAERLTEEFYNIVEDSLKTQKEKIKAKEGARAFLSYLKEKRLKVIILTGNMEEVVDEISRLLGLRQYVDKIYGINSLFPLHKPDKRVIERILKDNNLNKEEIIFFGDSVIDYLTSINSGITFIAIKSEIPIEDEIDTNKVKVFDNFNEALAYLKEMGVL